MNIMLSRRKRYPLPVRVWLTVLGLCSLAIAGGISLLETAQHLSTAVWGYGFFAAGALVLYLPFSMSKWLYRLTPGLLAASCVARGLSVLGTNMDPGNQFIAAIVWLFAGFTIGYRWNDLVPPRHIMEEGTDGRGAA